MLLFALVWGLLAHLQTIRERHERILAQAQRLFEARDLQTRDISDPSNAALAMIQPLLTSRHVGRKAQLLFAGVLVEHAYYSEAVPRLQRLLNGPPEIAGTAYALLARILWENSSLDPEDLRKIETYQKKAETLGPGTAEAYYLRAMAALTIREKLDFLEQALRLDRGHYPSRRLRALIFQASRKYGELRDEAVVIADRWPSDPLGSSLRAIALKELGDYQEAVGCYDTAIRLTSPQDPQYINLNEQRCAVLMRMGRYNLALEETRRCLEMATNAIVLQSHIFCALTALGRYEEAIALYQRLIKSDTAAIAQFKNRSMKHVFEMLEAGLAWHPLDNQPEGPAFLSMLEAEEVFHRLSAKAHRLTTDCFSGPWSPDGKKMALTLGLPGNSGVAIYDPATKETDLLIVPGKDASWSPNGQRIAFVRDCEVLRLSELTTGTERRGDHIYYRSEEVWVMNADGTQPRRLARGAGFPSWSRDSKHVYYQSRMEHMLCSISIEEPQAKPVPVFPCCAYHPSVSPDDKWVAHIHQEGEPGSPRTGVLKITDLASRSPVAEWAAPVTMSGGYWSPDGRELALLGGLSGTVSTGLWIYDVDKREAAKVLSGPIVHASWAPDRTQLLIRLGIPYHEIWVADLDPSLSTTEVLGPARTLEEHCRECIATCNRQLEADPNHRINHLERTACALWIDDDQARTYLKELDTAFDRMPRPVADYQNAQQILSCPPLRDHLMSLALVLARKASIHPHCARDLCHMLYRLGRYEQAAFLWPKIADSIPGGTCRYDEGSDSYTMVASGHDLFGTLDDLHFAGKKLQGDGSITARIDSIENVNEWTSAGIMIRSTLEPDCPGVLLVVTPAGRLYYRHRLAENEVSYSVDMPTNTVRLPHWLQLIRQGNHFMALHSSDGITWEDVLFGSDQQSVIQIPMGETVYVGLAANSRDFLKTAEARISHVTTTGHAIPAGPFKESRDIRFQLPVP
jgi:tetratricopeptide (TPR) repeat protein